MTEERLQPTLASLLSATDSPFVHRDLSWLQFNGRVLAEARDPENPLLERLKFLAISSSNLDEFFMIRFASLSRSISHHVRLGQPAIAKGLQSIRDIILREVQALKLRQKRVLEGLAGELSTHGIVIPKKLDESMPTLDAARSVFTEQIFPSLGQPETFRFRSLTLLGNLQTALVFEDAGYWLPVPKTIASAFIHLPKKGSAEPLRIFFQDELIETFAATAFGIVGKPPKIVRLTRDGDFTVDLEEEDTESIPDVVRSGIGRRERGRAVRLQHSEGLPATFIRSASGMLKIDPSQCLPAPRTVCLHGLWSVIHTIPESLHSKPELFYPPIKPVIPPQFKTQRKLFDHLKVRDMLLHHPYDSFDAFVDWIRMACKDPQVDAIQLTVYRTDAVSPVIDALKGAGKTKKIRVIIELRARFDELNNLRLADELRKSGVEVAFGFGKLKMHAKIALVTRTEHGHTQLYTHLSTGNYNAVTARHYTDLAILTANPLIGQDAQHFFDSVWQGKVPTQFKTLLSAPARMHRRILALIDAETKAAGLGQNARIVAKVNALVDESVIENLYKASNAGVKVDLIVRGACSLIPGVKGMSENIRVISIVDRYLEHSRIYSFESTGTIYLSSADWMPRNFFSRLEIAFPVLDPRIHQYLRDIVLPTYLADTVKGRELTSKGIWRSRKEALTKAGSTKPAIRSQFAFSELAKNAYRGTSLE